MANKIRGRGEGTIYQLKNGNWRFQIHHRGKRIGGTYETKAEALSGMREAQRQCESGIDGDKIEITLRDYLLQWLENKKLSITAKTAHQYKQIIRDHILPYIGNLPVLEINLAKVERLYADLLKAKVGIRTIRLTHSVLHNALEKAVQYELIDKNPTHQADISKAKHSEVTYLDADQATQILIVAKSSRCKALYHLAIHTGMCQGELLGLKWSDMEWDRETGRVQRQIKRVPGQGWAFDRPKTISGIRTIKLAPGILNVLREHRKRQKLEKISVGDQWVENDLIFPTSVGTPEHQSTLRKDFLKVLKQAGLPKMRFHDLRHTAATLMLNNNIPAIVVSIRLGHAKTSITLDTYGHLIHSMQDEAAKVMDQLVTPIEINLEDIDTLEVEPWDPKAQNLVKLHTNCTRNP